MVVAGQVEASRTDHYNGLHGKRIKEVDLAKSILALPDRMNGKIVGTGTRLVPVDQVGQVVKIIIKAQESHNAFAMKKNRLVYDSQGQPLEGGVQVTLFRKILGNNRLVLYQDEKPVCLAIQDMKEVTRKAYFVYGPTPLSEGDKPKAKEDGIEFYRWFHVRDFDLDMQVSHRTVYVWNGRHFVALYNIKEAKKETNGRSSLEQAILDVPRAGDNVIVAPADDDMIYGLVLKRGAQKSDGWQLVIPPGSDPVVVLMIAVILDEMVAF